jgi:hypothetical protein
MAKVKNEHMLKEKMLVSGRSAGCGTCLWANEFEIGAVCSALHLVVLIIDGQSSGTNRFVRMSPPEPQVVQDHFVLLNRTRREHFNLITIQGRAVFSSDDLPLSVVSAWNLPLSRSGGAGGKRRSDENQGNDDKEQGVLPLSRSGGAGGKRRSDENQGNDDKEQGGKGGTAACETKLSKQVTTSTTTTTETVQTEKRHRRNGI